MTHQVLSYPNNVQLVRDWVDAHDGIIPLPAQAQSWIESNLPPSTEIFAHVGEIHAGEHAGLEWVPGFPHKHTVSMGWPASALTFMFYIDVPTEGGEILIGGSEPTDPYETIVPTEGMVIVIDADTYHGVKPVVSGLRRAIMVSTVQRP